MNIKAFQPQKGDRKIYVFNVSMAALGLITLGYFIVVIATAGTVDGAVITGVIASIPLIAGTFNWANKAEYNVKE